MSRPHTLVYHAGALGDFVTILPVLRVWRREHPGAHIALLGRAGHGGLAIESGYVDDVWDIEGARHACLFAPGADEADLEALAAFDAAIAFAADDAPLLANLARAGVRHILHQPPFPSSRQHVVDYHLSVLSPVPFTEADRIPRLCLCPAKAAPPPSRVAILHPGSGSQSKNWPFERFVALSEAIIDRGLEPVWLLGEAEAEVSPPATQRQIRMPALADAARFLSGAALYVGNDSGVTHLAAAFGCHTIAIFGPTDPRVWAPRGPRVTVITPPRATAQTSAGDSPHIEAVTLDEVQAAVAAVRGLA